MSESPRKTGLAVRDRAKKNGCSPAWEDGMFGWRWHCTCDDNLHCYDQQCSVITLKSAGRSREAGR